MKQLKDTKTMIIAALLTAFTCIATMVIQIPTPTLGYIHPGDSLVLLSGVILGPVVGGLTAGLGSMLADLLSGYVIYALPTFLIKAVSAMIAGLVFQKLKQKGMRSGFTAVLLAGILAEINVVGGYFINSLVQTMFLAGSVQAETFSAGLANALTTLIPNSVQGCTGILIGLGLFPILSQVPDIRIHITAAGKKTV